MSYTFDRIMTGCGDGYGRALVHDESNASVRVDVDVNTTDGSPTPRVRVITTGDNGQETFGAWQNVDAGFKTAFDTAAAALTNPDGALSHDSHEAACGRVRSDTDPGIGRVHPFWASSVPTLAAGASLGLNYLAYTDLYVASRDPGSVGTTLTLGSIGSKSLYALTFTPMTRHSDAAWTYSLSGIHAAGGLVLLGVAFAEPNGRGTPFLGTSVDMMTNGALGFCYGDRVGGRNPARFGTCAGLQGALGLTYLIMGLAGVGAPNDPSAGPMYATSGMAGARDVPGNPFEANRFTGMNYQLRDSGIAQLAGFGWNVLDALFISRAFDTSAGASSGAADSGRPTYRLSAMTPPGGGFGLMFTLNN